ncbi:MAG: caspase family protein [Deltaproteobacteria bacterium]|nr:caspase family protein [Deltaproteobacteria bacterium]
MSTLDTRIWPLVIALLVSCGAPSVSVVIAPTGRSDAAGARAPVDARLAAGVPSPAPAGASAPPARCDSVPPPAPDARARATLVVQDGHAGTVMAAELSPDGRRLVSGGQDGTARLWDTTTGLLLRRVATGGMTLEVSIDAAGERLAYRAHQGSGEVIGIVDAGTGATRIISDPGSIALGRDGRSLFVGLRTLRQHDASSGALVRELDFPRASVPCMMQRCVVRALALDPPGRRLAVALEGELALVDLEAWRVIRRWPQAWFAGPADLVTRLVFAHDTLAASTARALHLVGVAPGAPERTIPGTFLSSSVLGSRLLAADMTRRLAAWDMGSGAPAALPLPVDLKVDRIAASADASTLVLGISETDERVLQVRDGATLGLLRSLQGRTNATWALAMRPDATQLAAGSFNGRLQRWSLRSGALEGAGGGEEWHGRMVLSYDDSGGLVAETVGSWYVRVRSSATGALDRQWNAHASSPVAFVGFVPGTRALVSLDARGEIMRWDLAAPPGPRPAGSNRFADFGRPAGTSVGSLGGAKIAPQPARAPSAAAKADAALYRDATAALSPDGAWLAVAARDELRTVGFVAGSRTVAPQGRVFGEVQVELASTKNGAVRWRRQIEIAAPRERWLAFSADGRQILLSSDQFPPGVSGPVRPRPTLIVLDARSGATLRTIEAPSAGPVVAHGDLVALGGKRPALLAWPSLELRAPVATPDSVARAVAADGAGRTFAFGGESGALTVVSAAAGRPIAVLAATGEGDYVTATPEGEFASSLDGARSVAWTFDDPLEGFSFEQFAARFDRPELVAQRLAGVALPAGRLARPPTIELAAGSAPATTSARTISVRARVASPQRVERVRVFVDGRPAGEQLVCQSAAQVALQVPLHAGRNRVTAIAYDAEGLASHGRSADIDCRAPRAERPDLWVVALGVSRYPGLAPELQLDFADDDARAVATAMAAQAGSGRPFAGLHATTLVDEQVTPESVVASLAALAAMRPDDLALVFLAGHGVRLGDGKMVYLTSTAAPGREGARQGGVGWDRIEQALGRVRGRVLLLLDACHSGHLSTDIVAPNEELARALAAGERTGVLVLAAARGAQFSFEVPAAHPGGAVRTARGLELAWEGQPVAAAPLGAGGHGLFTAALLEALGGQAPDRDRSGALEVGELVDYVTERVRTASNGKQTPWVARRQLFGDFVVAAAGGP